MKILLCNSFFYPALGGIENYLLNIARVYVEKGHSVSVLTQAHLPHLPLYEEVGHIKITRFHIIENKIQFFQPWKLLKLFRKEANLFIQNNSFDLIICRDISSLSAIQSTKTTAKIIYIQATAYPLYTSFSLKNKGINIKTKLYWRLYVWVWSEVIGRIEKQNIKKTNFISVLSKAKLVEITNYYKLSSDNYKVIFPGVSRKLFSPCITDKDKADLKFKLGIPSNKTIFLFVGRFESEKNPEGILTAIKDIDKSNMHFVFVGNASESFIEKVKVNRLEEFISIIGAVSEPADYYKCSDVFLLPSYTEGFGQVILEAMVSGLPIIGFKNPPNQQILATEEIVNDGISGILVEYNNNYLFGKAIEKIALDQKLRSELSKNVLYVTQQKYTWENTAIQILDFMGIK